jgi:hypothetical protein
MATLILKNNTGSVVTIPDVGVVIPASGQDSYTDPKHIVLLAASTSVRTLLTAGTLTANDGTGDLSLANALLYLEKLWSKVGRDDAIQIPDLGGVISDTQHGSRSGGTLHALATADPGGVPGFLTAADKKKIDDLNVPGQVQLLQWFHLLPQPASSSTPASATESSPNYAAKARFLFNFARLDLSGTTRSGQLYVRGMVASQNGDVRVFNVTDNVEMAVINFTELVMTTKSVVILSGDIPTSGIKVCEIQMRKVGAGVITVESSSCDFLLTS